MTKKKIVLGLLISMTIIVVVVTLVMSGPVDRKDNEEILVRINAGASTSEIAYILDEKGTINNISMFKIISKLRGYDGKYKIGTYAVSKSMSMIEQMDILTSGKSLGTAITIPEGNTLEKNAKLLSESNIFSEEEFLTALTNVQDFDYKFLVGIPKRANRLEGFLYPDTYNIDIGTTPREFISTMLSQFDKIFTDKYYRQADKMDKSVLEIITIASIIEREAQTDEDKKNVSSVIYNRLDINMPLQMDSILAYITGEEKIKASLSDTLVDSEYNPYTNVGLPPGPICSPSKKSIEAALYPPKTKYLYFVATEKLNGTNVFSETYDDFLKNKKAFDKAYKKYIEKNPGKK